MKMQRTYLFNCALPEFSGVNDGAYGGAYSICY